MWWQGSAGQLRSAALGPVGNGSSSTEERRSWRQGTAGQLQCGCAGVLCVTDWAQQCPHGDSLTPQSSSLCCCCCAPSCLRYRSNSLSSTTSTQHIVGVLLLLLLLLPKSLRPKLSEEQKKQLEECYELMDADGSGAIDADELGAAFKVCVASGSEGSGVESTAGSTWGQLGA